jgi:hypothetical protein
MNVELLVELELAGKTEIFEENLPQVSFIYREYQVKINGLGFAAEVSINFIGIN